MKRLGKSFAALTMLAAAACLLLAVGPAEARVSRAANKNITMAYAPVTAFLLRSSENDETDETETVYEPLSGGWEQENDAYTLDFAVANWLPSGSACRYGQEVSLVLYVTAGVTASDSLTVKLTAAGAEYTGRAEQIQSGTLLYDRVSNGGWVYRFYDGAGAELWLPLVGGSAMELPMTLTVTGSGEYASSLTVEARNRPM